MKKNKILVLVFKSIVELFQVLRLLFQAWFTHTKSALKSKYQELSAGVKLKEIPSATEELS